MNAKKDKSWDATRVTKEAARRMQNYETWRDGGVAPS